MARSRRLAGWAAALGAGLSLAAAAPASAATVDLICGPAPGNFWPVSWHVIVNLDDSTVTAWMSGHSPRRYPPAPADITDDRVMFQRSSPDDTLDFTLNRKTGKLRVFSSQNSVEHWFDCRLTSEQAAPLF